MQEIKTGETTTTILKATKASRYPASKASSTKRKAAQLEDGSAPPSKRLLMDQAFLLDSERNTVYPSNPGMERLLNSSLSHSSERGSKESQPSPVCSKARIDSTVEPPMATAEILEPTYFGESQQTLVDSDVGTRSPSPESPFEILDTFQKVTAEDSAPKSSSHTGLAVQRIPLQEQAQPKSPSAKSPSAKSPPAKSPSAKSPSSTGSISPLRHEEEENIPPDHMLQDGIATRESIPPNHCTPIPPAIKPKGYAPNTKTLRQQHLGLPFSEWPPMPLQESRFRYPPRRRSNSNGLDLGLAEEGGSAADLVVDADGGSARTERQPQTAPPSVSSPRNNVDVDDAVSLLRDQLRCLAGNDGSSAIVNAVSRLQQGIDTLEKKLDKLEQDSKAHFDTMSYNLSVVHDLLSFLHKTKHQQLMATKKADLS